MFQVPLPERLRLYNYLDKDTTNRSYITHFASVIQTAISETCLGSDFSFSSNFVKSVVKCITHECGAVKEIAIPFKQLGGLCR